MTRSDIEAKLKPFTDSISDGSLSTLAAIKLNLSLLIELRKIGVSVPLIIEISGCSYSPSTFYVKFSQLRKEMQNNTINDSSTLTQNNSIKTQQGKDPIQKDNNIMPSTSNKVFSNADWVQALNIQERFHEGGLIAIIPTLTKAGWTPENYHLLRERFNITTIKKLLTVLDVEIKSFRFRKNIFKDGKAFFRD